MPLMYVSDVWKEFIADKRQLDHPRDMIVQNFSIGGLSSRQIMCVSQRTLDGKGNTQTQ